MGETRFSILDLASVREGGTIRKALQNTLDLAQHAEEWGFTRFWLAEHHNMQGIASAATSVLIGYVAAGTSTMRVGSGGVMLPNHAPLVIAEQFGTLETLYSGRIDLGIGRAPGSNGLAAHALRYNTDPSAFPKEVAELLAYVAPANPDQKVIAYPGVGTKVPIWLLGSTTYSAELAADLGLPFAFASHFAPALLHDAIRTYRDRFKPSPYLAAPYMAAGVPLVAAETDSEAERLATSMKLRHLNLIRGRTLFVPPPVDSMEGLWSPSEEYLVNSRLEVAVIGGPSRVQRKIEELLRSTGVDELIFTSDLFDHADRLRSFEIAGQAMRELNQRSQPA